jgi:hypothetical protein
MAKEWSEKQRQEKYTLAFEISDAGREVLDDLAAFCCADKGSYVQGDTHATAFNEGKRAVFLRIQRYLKNREVTDE